MIGIALFTVSSWVIWGAVAAEVFSVGGSSLRALLVELRGCDPLLYQYVDGGGFFTSHGQPSKQMRLVWYIYAQRYRDHHDDEFIRRCERVRRQFILTSALCGLVVVSLIAQAGPF